MATKNPSRSTRLRAALSAVACTATLSTVSTLTPVAAQAAPAQDIASLVASGSSNVADLAGAIADVQAEVARVERELGHYREEVNRALVDLQDARTKAVQARRGAATAREELGGVQSEIEAAQAKLDELSRTAYRRANTSNAVTAASGGDSREDMLTRQSYLRGQADKQQAVVDELERVRTEKANKESQLRKTTQLAEQREQRATEAESAARATLEQSQSQVAKASQQRAELVKQQEAAQKRLNQVRGLDSGSKGGDEARSEDKSNGLTRTREVRGQAAQPNRNDSSATTASVSVPAEQATRSAGAAAPSEGTERRNFHSEDANATVEESGSSAADATSAVEEIQRVSSENPELAQMSSDPEVLAAAGTAIGAAAALVGASQPEHSSLTQTDLDALAQGSSELAALQAPAEQANADSEDDAELAGEIEGVLEEVPDAETVSEEAADEVSDLGSNAQIEAVIARAESQIGVPYAWGGGDANGPTRGIRDGGVADSYGDYNKVGFDCSGLTLYAFAGAGISLPHYTGYQYQRGEQVPADQMKRGDLIFYGANGGDHVAIYLGDGMMIEAPQSGSTVQKTPVRQAGMAPNVVRLL